MAEHNIIDDRPIAQRKKSRHASLIPSSPARPKSIMTTRKPSMPTPPETPKPSKKRARFSDPGPSVETDRYSTGLTPSLHRASLRATPPSKKRRCSTLARSATHADWDTPMAETVQFSPLRQVLDRKTRSRIRRHGLSEEMNTWDQERRELKRLRNEMQVRDDELRAKEADLLAKDAELQTVKESQRSSLQSVDDTIVPLDDGASSAAASSRQTELELQIEMLKAESQQHKAELEQMRIRLQEREMDTTMNPDWTVAARDPFDLADEEDSFPLARYDDFSSMMGDEMMTTPTRLRAALPSPPASSLPATPSKSMAIQTSFTSDTSKFADLEDKLQSLEDQISRCNATKAFDDDTRSRMLEKLAEFLPVEDAPHDHRTLDSALDTVLTELALAQSSNQEISETFDALNNEIRSLGFSSGGPEEAIEAIAQQFRQARLDLEYLTPGEVPLGFENQKLLDMLLSCIRKLLEKIEGRDVTIDEYHEQEILLRQRLESQTSAMENIQNELLSAHNMADELKAEATDKEISMERLKTALNSYRDEVKGLEEMIERRDEEVKVNERKMLAEFQDMEGKLQNEMLSHDTTRACEEGKDVMISELQMRLTNALQAAEDVQAEMEALIASRDELISEKDALISRLEMSSQEQTARLIQNEEEIGKINGELQYAKLNFFELQGENKALVKRLQSKTHALENAGNKIIDQCRELFLQAAAEEQAECDSLPGMQNVTVRRGGSYFDGEEGSAEPARPRIVLRKGEFLDGSLARRTSESVSAIRKRRYDSGIGIMEEDDDEAMN